MLNLHCNLKRNQYSEYYMRIITIFIIIKRLCKFCITMNPSKYCSKTIWQFYKDTGTNICGRFSGDESSTTGGVSSHFLNSSMFRKPHKTDPSTGGRTSISVTHCSVFSSIKNCLENIHKQCVLIISNNMIVLILQYSSVKLKLLSNLNIFITLGNWLERL